MLLDGRFELRRRIGAGGLAEVFEALDVRTGAEVAVKMLHPHLARDPSLRERFRRELSIARSLEHPGIVRLFDLHQHRGRPFISMERLRGRTLQERILGEGPLPPEEARAVVREICAALGAAHRQGVVHRDLKPQNVFLSEGGAVKVLDFGLARVLGEARLTAEGAAGTPGYIAPEVLAGEPGDARADLYALGALWYEMLRGQRWCESGATLGEGADGDALRRALEPDPELRFLDAGQFLRALDGAPVPAPLPAALALRAGDYDVLVHDVVRAGAPLRDIGLVLRRLGAEAPLAWKCRLLGAGEAVLVSGARRRTAEAVAQICAEQGLPATVRPVWRRPRSEEWLWRHGGWLLALSGAVLSAILASLLDMTVLWLVLGAGTGYSLSWGLRPPASEAPLSGQPAQKHDALAMEGA